MEGDKKSEMNTTGNRREKRVHPHMICHHHHHSSSGPPLHSGYY